MSDPAAPDPAAPDPAAPDPPPQVSPWPAMAATGIGSMPGTDVAEATRTVVGELPLLPYLAELPARGVGADLIGRAAAILVDLPVEVVPTGYRVAAHPGRDQRRAAGLLSRDLDALQTVLDTANTRPGLVKVQVAGPWTLTAGIELTRGHRVLTDAGALREYTESLAEGLAAHVAEVAARTGAGVLVQLDEPGLPAVLAGRLPTPSGYGMVPAVPEPDARDILHTIVEAARDATAGNPVVIHCCANRPPIGLLRSAGADAISFDAGLVARASAGEPWAGTPADLLDEIGEAWDGGAVLFLGLVPSTDPAAPVSLRAVAEPALRLADRLGFDRSLLADRAVPTPACGLAGTGQAWARRALALSSDLGKAFAEPPQSWAEPA